MNLLLISESDLYDANQPGLKPLATCQSQAVALRIAVRYNRHDKLVEALRELLKAQGSLESKRITTTRPEIEKAQERLTDAEMTAGSLLSELNQP